MSYVIKFECGMTGELYVTPQFNIYDRQSVYLGISYYGYGWTKKPSEALKIDDYNKASVIFEKVVRDMCSMVLEYDPRLDKLTIEGNKACLKRDDYGHYVYFNFYKEEY